MGLISLYFAMYFVIIFLFLKVILICICKHLTRDLFFFRLGAAGHNFAPRLELLIYDFYSNSA